MSVETIILLAGWGAICSVWFGLLVAQSRARREGLFLEVAEGSELEVSEHEDGPSVCVVIAARNESDGLGVCLRHVLEQDYSNLSVLVIDDRSEDDTHAVAQQFAQSDSRVRVQRVDDLPKGWMGKSHALWHGTRSVRTQWLLFIDVDCTLRPWAVRRAIDEARRRHVNMLSLWPKQAAGGFWEHAVIPLCGGIIALWFGSQRVNDPSSPLAFANGQFLLFERAAYEQIHGHQAVRSAMIEDIPLAEHAKKSGLSCWVASGRDLVSVRMYESYDAILEGWSRIFVGALRSGTKIALGIVWLALGSLLPYVAGVGLVMAFYSAWVTGAKIPTDLICFAAVCANHLILMMIVSYRFWGMGGCRRTDLIWYPLSVVLVIRILGQAWWWLSVKRCICWSGTVYRIDRKGVIVG